MVRSAHWSQQQGGLEPKLYYRCAVFFADDYHWFQIEMAPARQAIIKVVFAFKMHTTPEFFSKV